MIRRLVAHGSIKRLEDAHYQPIKRTFAVNAIGPAIMASLARLAVFIEPIALIAERVPLLIAALEEEALLFVEQIEAILEAKRGDSLSGRASDMKEIGVGMYLLERDG